MPYLGSSPARGLVGTTDIDASVVSEAKLKISNSPVNGYMLTAQSGDTGGLTWAAAGSGYEFVSSGSASGGASIDFTNMADGYDYIYVFQHISSASDAVSWTAEVGVSGPTYRTSGYKTSLVGINNAGSSTSIESTSHFLMVSSSNEGMGTGSGEAIKGGEFVLFNPANSSTETAGQSQVVLYGATPQLVPKFGAGYYATAEANVAVRFKTSSGNCTGTILQFRRARS